MNRTLALLVPAVVPAALLVVAPPAAADTDGLAFGVGFHSNNVAADDPPPDPAPGAVYVDEAGGGANLWIGYGITPSFTLRLLAAGASHGTTDPDVDVAWGGVTLEAQYLFRDPRPWRPYVTGGVGGYTTSSRQDALDFEATGGGIVLGGGVLYFFNDTWAMDLALRGSLVNWEEMNATFKFPDGSTATVATPIEEDGGALDILIGVSWWL